MATEEKTRTVTFRLTAALMKRLDAARKTAVGVVSLNRAVGNLLGLGLDAYERKTMRKGGRA